ncbi:MAG: response regulator, partial [Spirochaetota bacterium]
MNENKSRILVVDDEAGMREGCRRVLTSEGYKVETAEDGIGGLELFKKRDHFSAAIVDIKMPRMDGIELIEKIHEIDEDAILLVITAYSTINSAVEATKRGAYGYIPKPFTPDELLLPVKKGLEKRALTLEARRLNKEKEKRLLEIASERSKANTIIRCMTDGIIVVNMDKQIVLHNTATISIIPELKSIPLPTTVTSIHCVELQDL